MTTRAAVPGAAGVEDPASDCRGGGEIEASRRMDGDENPGAVRQLAREDGLLLISAGEGTGWPGGRGVTDAERAQPLFGTSAHCRAVEEDAAGRIREREILREGQSRDEALLAPVCGHEGPARSAKREWVAGRRQRNAADFDASPRTAPARRLRVRSCRRRSRRSRGGRGARRARGKEKFFLLGRRMGRLEQRRSARGWPCRRSWRCAPRA